MAHTAPPPAGYRCWICDWEEARSLSDIGQCMNRWLRGEHYAHPGYGEPPARETMELTGWLVQMNAVGIVTTGSQPSLEAGPWRQRAFLDGFGPRSLIDHVIEIAHRRRRGGIIADSWNSDWHVQRGRRHEVTTHRGRGCTWESRFGLNDVLCLGEVQLTTDALHALKSSRSFYIIENKSINDTAFSPGAALGRAGNKTDGGIFEIVADAAVDYLYQHSVGAWPDHQPRPPRP